MATTSKLNLENVRRNIRRGKFTVYKHAVEEAMKDGLTGDDLLYVALNGEVIEDYPERQRCLLFAITPNALPVHVVIDYRPEEPEIVTIYIPDKREWIRFRRRKKPVRKRRKS